MKCHYELLGLTLDADVEDIKKAYRKLALKWHPDKNRENSEEATEQFRLVQAAYDVLSDPQEKAWYDRHRTEILHKSQFAAFKDETLDILEYFTPSVYRGFGNDAKGFYAVYRDVFKKLTEEDRRFCSGELDSEDEIPEFGDSTSDYDDVVHAFYAFWQSYCTKLSYVWIDKYDVHDAPDRRISRLIEKENKKERDKEKKKRNEIVRELVRFVRKRDPRVRMHREHLQRIATQQTEKAAGKRAEILRSRVEEAALFEEQYQESKLEHAERVAQLEDMLKEEFGFSSSGDEEDVNGEESDEEQEELYCVACNKQFKTRMAIKNHQKSKKHKEKMTLLHAEMSREKQEEERISVKIDESDSDEMEPRSKKLTKKQKKQRKLQNKLFNEMQSSNDVTDDITDDDAISTNDDVIATNDDVLATNDDVLATNDDVVHCSDPADCDVTEAEINNEQRDKNLNKSKNKKEKTKSKKQKNKQLPTNEIPPNYCVTCQTEYPSRNKLFQHLKSSGHSMPLEGATSKSKKSKRR